MHPYGMEINSQADGANSRIQKFAIPGKYKTHFGSGGHKEGKLCQPEGIAIDPDDLVYVSEFGNGRISVFTPSGRFIKCFGGEDQGSLALQNPSRLTFNENGDLYVCDSELGQLVVF